MIKSCLKLSLAASFVATTLSVGAATATIDFEGQGFSDLDGAAAINAAYGPTVQFSANSLVIESGATFTDAGHASPHALWFGETASVGELFVPGGFDSFSFWYSTSYSSSGVASVYGATHNFLGSWPLLDTGSDPMIVWDDQAGAGSPPAFYLEFSNISDGLGLTAIDDIQFGLHSEQGGGETPVPEPSTVIGGAALAGLMVRRVLRKK